MRWLLTVPFLVLAIVAGAPPASAAADPTGEWPLSPAPEVVSGFDPPTSPWAAGHRGVDLLGRAGQRVRSALPGRVSYAGTIAGVPMVSVDHGSTRTTYQPVVATLARGSRVAGGEPIGTLSLTGSHCWPRACLHWGWLRDQTYLDPLDLVGAGAVRLLPLGGLTRGTTAPGARPLQAPYVGWQSLLRLLQP